MRTRQVVEQGLNTSRSDPLPNSGNLTPKHPASPNITLRFPGVWGSGIRVLGFMLSVSLDFSFVILGFRAFGLGCKVLGF